MNGSDEPSFDSAHPTPDGTTGGDAHTSNEHDHELAVVRQQIASALFPLRNIAPSTIGRFVVERRLGAGAMGVVYAARDPALDRRVAIKLVRPDVAGDRKAQLRLEREAKALAKLSHPNIVAVHEVGEHKGQVYLAMEHVQGLTLRAWQERARRTTAEVLAMYVQAARGLAAAHAAGLVHRDFKPDNVLVDDDGRARVVDFGLVGGDERERRAELARWQTTGNGTELVLTTHTHALVGTPAYMSPEHFEGTAVDARSDQFAFCVALWEALHGERPFGGESLPELCAEVIAGQLRTSSKATRVPSRLRRACERGLSVDPQQRWPSMDALVAELHALATPRGHRWIAVGLAGGLTVLAGGLAASRYVEVLHRCDGAAAELEGLWDDTRRQAVKHAIVGTGLSYAEDTWVRVEQRLDDYASAWVDARTEACEATSVRHEQSAEVMDLRMGCLRGRQLALREAVDVLAQADATRVEHAVELLTALPSLSRCSDVDALRAELPPPEDPQVAAQVEALREQLVHARALLEAGAFDAGLAEAGAVVEQAEPLGFPPLLAEALWARGSALEALSRYAEAEQDLEQAYLLAAQHGHDEVEANASVSLVYVVGIDPARSESANQWGRTALALAQGAHVGDDIEVSALNNIGVVLEIQGRLDESLTHQQRALALAEEALDPRSVHLASALGSMGTVLAAQGRLEEALVHYRRSLGVLEETVGPRHPLVSATSNNIGTVLHRQRKLDDAREHYERALAILEGALGPRHAKAAHILENIGATLRAQGRLGEALPYLHRALAIAEESMGPRHPDVASGIIAIGVVLMHQGRLDDALIHFRRALPIVEESLGTDHFVVAGPLSNIGHVLRAQGDLDGALSHHRRALAIREAALGPRHKDVGLSLANIGDVLLARGTLAEAHASHARSLAISEEALGPDHPQVAAALRGLGDVLRAQGRLDAARSHHERALAIIEQALGTHHPSTADALVSVAETALARHDHAVAREHAERAVSILEASEVSPVRLAEARFMLARATWDAAVDGGRDRASARRLAKDAREALAAAGSAGASELVVVDRWLAEHDVGR